jgi:hypothetical protein
VNHRVLALTAAFLLCTTTASFANEATPAWQEPGFMMEEVIVTARADDISESAQNPLSTHARMLRGFRMHQLMLQRLAGSTAESDH